MRAPTLLAAACVAVALPAAAQTDPSGDYRTWTSAHFRVHARAELRPAAERLVAEAERAWALLATELRPPPGRVDLTLLDNVDFANGFATVFPSNRITIYLSSPAGDVSLGHYDDWLRLVVTHELVHVFHLDPARGLWRVPRALFGRAPALFPNAYQPSWVSEGIATYYESRFTAAGRVRGGFHAQLLVARAGRGWPDPNDAGQPGPAWPGGFRSYAWGSRFFAHQTALHGDSVVPRFVEETAGQLWPLAISGPLRRAGGDPLYPGWTGLAQAWSGRGAPVGRIVRRGLLLEPRPRVGPDGRRFAYVEVTGRDGPDAVVYDPATDRVVRRRQVNGDAELAWVGDTLYLSQLDFASPVTIWADLYRWRPDGGFERLTHGARLTTPFAVPAGGVGVVTTLPGTHAVSTYDAARDALGALPSPPGTDWGRLAVSPDGAWVAGARHRHGRWDIVVWPWGAPDRLTVVTDDAALDADPAWSPDGTLLLFMSERYGVPQVFAWRRADGGLLQLTAEPTGARQPAVTRDGALLYTTVLHDGYAILRLAAPEPLVSGSPDAAAAGFTPAPPADLEESAYRPWPALRPHYWLPILKDAGVTGTFLGFATSGDDPIGRTAYGTIVTVAPSSGRVDGVFGVRHARWRAVALDVSAEQDWSFAGVDQAGTPFSNRERFVTGGVNWRWRRWRASAFARLGAEWEGDRLVAEAPTTNPLADFSLRRWGPVVSAGVGRTERPPYAISPENGATLSGLYRHRREVGGDRHSHEWRGQASAFLALPLPGFARWVLAANARVGLLGGPLPATFEVGGASGAAVELAPGIAVGERRSFPLRGYPADGGRFRRVATGSVELRVPLALVDRGLWRLPLGLDRVSGTLFADVGTGWDAGGPDDLFQFAALGAEGVIDVTVGSDLTLRLRAGAGVPLTDGLGAARGDVRGHLAVGASF